MPSNDKPLAVLPKEWVMMMQKAQLRLRCAEIVYTTGSQVEKTKLEENAKRLYNFAMEEK